MLCNVCKESIEGIWDANRSTRIAIREELEEKYGSGDESEPGPMWAEYWATFRESKQDLKNLEPSECVFAHHRDMASLTASRQVGCAICNVLLKQVTPQRGWSQDRDQDSCAYFSIICVKVGKIFWNISIYTRTSHINVEFRVVRGKNCNHNDDASDVLKNGTTNSLREETERLKLKRYRSKHGTSTDSAQTWSIICGWMKDCIHSHETCRELGMTPSFRPTRLLEINECNSFRLVTTSQYPPDVRYAALSYCWGPKPAHSLRRLIRSTLKDLSEWQPLDGLPKTFRDAMRIIQRLGLQYLWIDRLCILQDSAEDWRHEASTMQDVYRNAYIGIGALGAKDDEGGCFFKRDPATLEPAVLSLKNGRGSKSTNLIYAGERMYETWRYTFEHEPLCKRSWVVQERLLAARTLYFGSKQVFWECRTRACCEIHPKGMDPVSGPEQEVPTDELRSHLWKRLLAAGETRRTREPRSQLLEDWETVVGHYASLQLTIPSDKLVALSGLANDMKRELHELQPGSHRYLAGLWEDALIRQLCWATTSPAKRASQYRAPSWSWACLDGHVEPRMSLMPKQLLDDPVELATMISAEMVYPSEEETGEVESGVLTLEGPCMWVKLRSGKLWLSQYSSEVRVTFDTLDDMTEEVFLLWTSHDYFFDHESSTEIKGLALVGTENDTYRRIGAVIGQVSKGMIGFIKALPPTRVSII